MSMILTLALICQLGNKDLDLERYERTADKATSKITLESSRRSALVMKIYKRELPFTELLVRDDVKGELRLSKGQSEELSEVRYLGIIELKRRTPELEAYTYGISLEHNMTEREFNKYLLDLTTAVNKDNERVDSEIEDVLTSRQMRRLREIRFQYCMTFRNVHAALKSQGIELPDTDVFKIRSHLARRGFFYFEEFAKEKGIELLFPVLSRAHPKFSAKAGKQFEFDRSLDTKYLHELYDEMNSE